VSVVLPVPLGSVYAMDGASETLLTPAWARVDTVRVDVSHHRAPYGTDWWVGGSGRTQPLTLAVTVMDFSSGISAAAPDARSTIAALEAADLLLLPFGVFQTAGLLGWTVTPVEAGYRVEARVAVRNERPEGYMLTYEGDDVTYGGDAVAYLGG